MFPAAVVPILQYVRTTWTFTKRIEKKLDGNCTRILRAILKKFHPTKQLCGHLPPISKTIQIRRTRHVGHCWKNKDDLIRDVLQETSRERWLTGTNGVCVCEKEREREGWGESRKLVLSAWPDDDDDKSVAKKLNFLRSALVFWNASSICSPSSFREEFLWGSG